MDGSLIIFLIAILIVGILVFLAIAMTSKHGHVFDKENYQVDFLRIEQMLEKDNPASYSMAIIEGDKMLDHSQNHQSTLLFPVSSERAVFSNTLAGEAWFQLGDMTVAEQSTITSLQASPKRTGARFLVRLAKVNLVTGEDAAARKYLDILSRTLFYGKWARSVMPGRQDEATRKWIAESRAKLMRTDFIHQSDDPRTVLQALLEADPANALAREYLLCYDLLCYDLDGFIQEYAKDFPQGRLYREAVLIWLSRQERLNPAEVGRYGVDVSEVDRMGRFGRNPGAFKNTYWYYYLTAMQEAQQQP